MRLFFFCCLLLQHLYSDAQTRFSPVQRSVPVASAYSNHFRDVFSFAANEAALAFIKQSFLGVYSEKRFMIKELNLFLLNMAVPHSSGGFGLMMNYSGNKIYRETSLALCFGKKLTDLMAIGVRFNYFGSKVTGSAAGRSLNAEAGVILQLTENVQSGFHIKNPVNLQNSERQIATTYGVGLGYDCSDKVLLTANVEKEEGLPVNFNIALQYAFVSTAYLLCGLTTVKDDLYFGIGFRRKAEKLEINAAFHRQLGITPAIVLVFPFGKNMEE